MKIKEIAGNIDKKALATSIGIMTLSWAALPIVYYLLIKIRKKEEGDKENGE